MVLVNKRGEQNLRSRSGVHPQTLGKLGRVNRLIPLETFLEVLVSQVVCDVLQENFAGMVMLLHYLSLLKISSLRNVYDIHQL